MKVGLTFDLRPEEDASGPPVSDVPFDAFWEFDQPETIDSLSAALESLGHQVIRIGGGFHLVRRLALDDCDVDIVFNLSEGASGRNREALVPALLELAEIAYTFSDPLTLAVCHDKSVTKRLWQSSDVPTPSWRVVDSDRPVSSDGWGLGWPLFVKPLWEGTSKGVSASSICKDSKEARHAVSMVLSQYRQPALVEPFLTGPEYTVGLLGTGPDASVVGIAQICVLEPSSQSIYGSIEKEECETRVNYLKVTDEALVASLGGLALKAYLSVGCRDAGRVDIRYDDKGHAYVLELNPLPGLHPTHSDLPIIATQQELSYESLIEAILDSAAKRVINGLPRKSNRD